MTPARQVRGSASCSRPRHLSGLLFLLFALVAGRLPSRLLGRFSSSPSWPPSLQPPSWPLRCRRSFLDLQPSWPWLSWLCYSWLGFLGRWPFLALAFWPWAFGTGLSGFGFNGLLGFDSLLGRCDLLDFDRSLGFVSLRALSRVFFGSGLLVGLGSRHVFRNGLLRRFL